MKNYDAFVMSLLGETAHDRRVFNCCMGLSGEAGETVDLLKKSHFHGKPLDRKKLLLELGDTVYYLTALANLYGFSLAEVIQANEEKLRARFPNGFSHDAANARADEAPAKDEAPKFHTPENFPTESTGVRLEHEASAVSLIHQFFAHTKMEETRIRVVSIQWYDNTPDAAVIEVVVVSGYPALEFEFDYHVAQGVLTLRRSPNVPWCHAFISWENKVLLGK